MAGSNKANREAPSRGARDQKVRLSDRWRSYRAHHSSTLRTTLAKIFGEPIQTLLTVVVIAIALALPSAMLLVLHNVQQLGTGIESSQQMTVFVEKTATRSAIDQLGDDIEQLAHVASVTYISEEQALEEFKASSGFGSALQYLDKNPLPAVFLVQPKLINTADITHTQDLVTAIAELNAVDEVQIDMLWMQRLLTITEISQKLVLAIGIALGVGVLLVIGNTIRLAIQSRRDEIIVVKLVGGTDAYVRRPFLYTGLLLGLLGAMMASLMLVTCVVWLGRSVNALADLYQSQFHLVGPGFSGILTLWMIGALIGVMGAWVAVMQHLREIEPK